jgi:prolyl oligopeptidase
MKTTIILLSAALAWPVVAMSTEADHDQDPYLWLEEIESEQALDWAKAQNERSIEYLESHPLFEPIH